MKEKKYKVELEGGEKATIMYNEEVISIKENELEKIIKTVKGERLLMNLRHLAEMWGIKPLIRAIDYKYYVFFPFKYLDYFTNRFENVGGIKVIMKEVDGIILEGGSK